MTDAQVIIIGAGFSGISLAWKLSQRQIRVQIIESDKSIGGLAGTLRENGYCLDVGPHSFFSEDDTILTTVLNLFDRSLQPMVRRTKFYYQGRYLDYPLTPSSVLFQMGIWSGMRAGLSFIRGQFKKLERNTASVEEESVEEWAIRSFGKYLYYSFFKPYTEQFWKIPCSDLSARSIPSHTRMSFINTLRLLVQRKIDRLDPNLIEREMLPTYYPEGGFVEFSEHIANAALNEGMKISLGCQVYQIDKSRDGSALHVRFEQDGTNNEIVCSHVVSTAPLNQFIKMLPSAPLPIASAAAKLEYRSLIVLGMVTEKQNILDCCYIYVINRPYNRIAEMSKFNAATSPSGENIVMVEIPCLMDSKIWSASKEEIFELCIESLATDGFLKREEVRKLLMVKAPNAYPIYRIDYAQNLRAVLDYINSCHNLSTLGRTGEFRYMDVDQCMRRAFDFAEKFCKQFDDSQLSPEL